MSEADNAPSIPFRTACDPCSASKIRCDKRHPICDRCAQVQLPCSYSESRKHGKQSWKRRLAYERRMHGTATTDSHPPWPQAGTNIPTGWNSVLLQGSNDMSANLALPAWSFADGSGVEINIDDFAGSWDVAKLPSLSDSQPTTQPSITATTTTTAVTGLLTPASSNRDLSNSNSVSDTSESALVTVLHPHDCEARAVSILQTMQHGEMCQGVSSCDSNPTQYTTLNLAPSFDRVLAVNKAALDGWSQLMSCSCALCPHIILLHVSILSKMTFWYRIAASERRAVPHAEPAHAQTHAHTPAATNGLASEPTLPSSAASPLPAPTVKEFSVQPIMIQIGSLALDLEEQANLRRMLLLTQLNKMDKAIEALLNVDRTAIEDQGDEAVQRSVNWSLGGIMRVREEVQDLIQQVNRGLAST